MAHPAATLVEWVDMLAAVIFDVDGLLVDTESADWEAWRELFHEHGHPLELDEYCHNAGRYGCWDALYAQLAAHCGVSADDLHARRNPRFREIVAARLTPDPALIQLLTRLEQEGIRRGVASASDTDWVHYLIDGLGLRPHFEVIVTGQDCPRRKPDPACYLQAAQILGVAPEWCAALEDSATGIAAARAAGMRVIAIPNLVSQHQNLSGAHLRVACLEEVTLDVLRSLFRDE